MDGLLSKEMGCFRTPLLSNLAQPQLVGRTLFVRCLSVVEKIRVFVDFNRVLKREAWVEDLVEAGSRAGVSPCLATHTTSYVAAAGCTRLDCMVQREEKISCCVFNQLFVP